MNRYSMGTEYLRNHMSDLPKLRDKVRSRIMRANKSKGTRLELKLQMAFCRAGLCGYRLNCRNMVGTPDFCFKEFKVAVFVHGCFWHGCRTCKRNLTPKSNSAFWANKVRNNRARDSKVRHILEAQGWTVITVWEHSVSKDVAGVVKMVSEHLHKGFH